MRMTNMFWRLDFLYSFTKTSKVEAKSQAITNGFVDKVNDHEIKKYLTLNFNDCL